MEVHRGTDSELYDLTVDPDESTNIQESKPLRVTALRDALRDLRDRELNAPVGSAGDVPITEDTAAKLRSLGYVGARVSEGGTRDDRPDPKKLIRVHMRLVEARELVATNKLEQAVTELALALERDPTNPAALSELLKLADRAEVRDAAVSALRRVVEQLPEEVTDPFPFLVGGIASTRVGDLERAERWLRRTIALDPDSGDGLYNLGQVLLLRGREASVAEPFLQRAFELDPANELYADGLARLHRQENRPDREASVYLRLIEQRPAGGRAYYKAAMALHRSGQIDRAIDCLGRGVAKASEPDAPWVIKAKARLEEWKKRAGKDPETEHGG